MDPLKRIEVLPSEQQGSIERLRDRVGAWFQEHPERISDFHSITLFGSRAVGLADSELSDWDLYVIMQDDAPKGTSPADQLILHENCPTEWHRNTVSGYLEALHGSSTNLSRAVEKYGIPIYERVPTSSSLKLKEGIHNLNLTQFNASLLGIVSTAESLSSKINVHYDSDEDDFSHVTHAGEPYDPDLFKHSSNFAEHIAKLIVKSRDIVPRTIHQLDRLAQQLAKDDPYRDRIAALNGATRDGNIAIYMDPAPPKQKAEDEPLAKSYQRIEGAFCLLDDFLADYAERIEPDQSNPLATREFKRYMKRWKRHVEGSLAPVTRSNPTAEWLQRTLKLAKSISIHLRQMLHRIQPE